MDGTGPKVIPPATDDTLASKYPSGHVTDGVPGTPRGPEFAVSAYGTPGVAGFTFSISETLEETANELVLGIPNG